VELQQDIHLVDGVVCNVYLILESDGVTMIDTGTPGRSSAVIAYLGKLGRSVHDLRNILLTHQHVDHIGNAASLSTPSGAQITAHPADAPAIEGKAPRELPNSVVMRSLLNLLFVWRLKPLQVDNQVSAGQTLPILPAEGGLQVVETPGHTTGHISFYLPGRKLLFAGDAYRHANGKLVPSPRVYNHDTPEALRSMAILTDYDIEASLPGHGVPILADAGARLGEAVARIRATELRE
jgi:glyoxylase-like metal-dependent hydrolase (beta-lactamase superfamily II)